MWYSTEKVVGDVSLQWNSAISVSSPTNIFLYAPSGRTLRRMYRRSYSRPWAQRVTEGRDIGRRDLMGKRYSYGYVRYRTHSACDELTTVPE